MEFKETDSGIAFEFGEPEEGQMQKFRREFREWFFGEYLNLAPYQIAWLEAAENAPAFNEGEPPAGDDAPPKTGGDSVEEEKEDAVTEADIKKRQDELAQEKEALEKEKAEFAAKKSLDECKVVVAGLVKDGKLTVGLSDGVAEFMAGLPNDEASAFEFSEGDKVVKKSPRAFMEELLGRLGAVAEFTELSDEGEDEPGKVEVDAQDLAAKALEYQQSQAGKGVTITTAQAIEAVKEGK